MQPREFKAWFEGFTEAFSGTPTKAQWARIKERVAEVDGNPITERVFVDRWGAERQNTRPWRWVCGFYQSPTAFNTVNTQAHVSSGTLFNSAVAMTAVGRAEAAQISARGAS
jgi:hypothetical protein